MIGDEFVKALKRGRKEYCMTQAEAGSLAMISQRHYCEYERGEHIPSLIKAQELLNAVGYELKIAKMEV